MTRPTAESQWMGSHAGVHGPSMDGPVSSTGTTRHDNCSPAPQGTCNRVMPVPGDQYCWCWWLAFGQSCVCSVCLLLGHHFCTHYWHKCSQQHNAPHAQQPSGKMALPFPQDPHGQASARNGVDHSTHLANVGKLPSTAAQPHHMPCCSNPQPMLHTTRSSPTIPHSPAPPSPPTLSAAIAAPHQLAAAAMVHRLVMGHFCWQNSGTSNTDGSGAPLLKVVSLKVMKSLGIWSSSTGNCTESAVV